MRKKAIYRIIAVVCLLILLASNNALLTFSRFVLQKSGVAIENSGIGGVKYTVTYMDEQDNVLGRDYVTNNSVAYNLTFKPTAAGKTFANWTIMANPITSIEAGYNKDVVVYASWNNIYVVYFYINDEVVYQEQFTKGGSLSAAGKTAITEALNTANNNNTDPNYVYEWDDYVTLMKNATGNVVVSLKHRYKGTAMLTPTYDAYGNILSYSVSGSEITNASSEEEQINNLLVSIPGSIDGVPVTSITAGAFANFSNLHAVVIPREVGSLEGVASMGSDAFSNDSLSIFSQGQTITIYYEGSYNEWQSLVNKAASGWDDGLSKNTCIFFLNGGDKVDSSQGYMKRTTNWAGVPNGWEHKTSLDSGFNSTYTGTCDCKEFCNGEKTRPDAIYWPAK